MSPSYLQLAALSALLMAFVLCQPVAFAAADAGKGPVKIESTSTAKTAGASVPEPGPSSPAAAPRFDKWIIIGPGGGGAQYYPTISPNDPKKVCVRCDMTGAYITDDGGKSWRMFNRMNTAEFFVFDPADPKVIYAKSVALWRSADSGKTWNLVHPDPSNVKKVIVSDDHAGEHIAIKDGSTDTVAALAVDPSDSKTLYAAISSGQAVQFAVSKDWGRTWKREAALPWGAGGRGTGYGCRKLYVDPKSPKNSRTIYAIGTSQVSVRERGKWTNLKAPQGVTAFSDASLGFPPKGGKPVVYAIAPPSRAGGKVSTGGVIVSSDGGITWRDMNADIRRQVAKGGRGPWLAAIATCLTNPDVAYLSFSNADLGPAKGGACDGVARTTDGGKTWDFAVRESDKASPNVKDAWVNARLGVGWGGIPRYLAVAPTDANVCYATDDGRTMYTHDGLKTWNAAYSVRWPRGAAEPNCTYTTTGLDVTTCYGVHFDPFNENRIFITYTDIGLWYSEDRGTSWISAEVPDDWRNTTYWMVFDPEVKGRAWSVMSSFHDLPRPKMWRDGGTGHYNGGVAISEDGGKTWKKSIGGMPPTACTHIILDPKSPKDARVLYATGFGTGVWKSTDGCKTWTLKNKGIGVEAPKAWRLAIGPGGALYLIIARGSEEGEIGNAADGRLYRSTDGAESWSEVKLPQGTNGPNGLAIDPSDPKRMYLAAWGRMIPDGASGGGIFLTTDAGRTWQNVLSKNQYLYDVTIDPRDTKTLYTCGFQHSAWRSTDRGETWTRLKGYTFKWGHRVVCDPKDPSKIFVTTFGGSVWYGPAAGDPTAAEDIVTPVVSYEAVNK